LFQRQARLEHSLLREASRAEMKNHRRGLAMMGAEFFAGLSSSPYIFVILAIGDTRPIEPPEKGKSFEGEIFDIHLACLQSHLQETRKRGSAKIINRDFATGGPVHNPSRIQSLR
jgi:hypothetical protein